MVSQWMRALVSITAVVTATLPPAMAADSDDISVAEQRIFLDHHLQNIRDATDLPYAFTQTGSDSDRFTDQVILHVGAGKPEARALKVDFLSGSRRLNLSSIEGGTGNPVILYFLENDIRDLHNRLGGQEAYFRKRIRMALAEKATVRPVQLRYAGKTIDGHEVTISPYRDDPLKDRLKQFVSKSYVFTLSSAVPGGLYELKTHVDADGTAPALDTVLTLERR